MLTIELVYKQEDEQTTAMRAALREALHMAGMPPRWRELRADDDATEGLGTPLPAVLVEGTPVEGGAALSRAEIFVALQEHAYRR